MEDVLEIDFADKRSNNRQAKQQPTSEATTDRQSND
jgi:hypothetical protein